MLPSLWAQLKPTNFTVITDAEPDSLLALLILQRLGNLVEANVVITGWNDPQQKANFVCRNFSLQPEQVFIGLPSPLDFSYGDLEEGNYQSFQPAIFQDAVVLCLAPPTELLLLDSSFFRESTLAISGGLNVSSIPTDDLLRLYKSFDRAILYEGSFPIHNTEFLGQLPGFLTNASLLWNDYAAKAQASIGKCPMQILSSDSVIVHLLFCPDLPNSTQKIGNLELYIGNSRLYEDHLIWLKALF
jgi:hypothetical protein